MRDELIFGYTWAEIQTAQKGGKLHHEIPPSSSNEPLISDSDMELFAREGFEGLEKLGFYGLIDRLKRSGITEGKEKNEKL